MRDGYTILIGDSWGCGEWNINHHTIDHRGLAEYATNVINLSITGSSNWEIVVRLKNFLMTNKLRINKVFVVQTEYSRDVSTKSESLYNPCEWHREINNVNSLQDYEIAILSKFYSLLSELAVEHHVLIGLIGGCADIASYDKFNEDYPNLYVACQSWINLILNNTPEMQWNKCVYSWYTEKSKKLIPIAKDKFNNTEDIINCIDKGSARYELLLSHPEFFYPDGTHPNRTGHKILFDYLTDNKLI